MAHWVNGLAFKNIKFTPKGKPVIKISEIKNGISGQTKFTEQEFDESVRVCSGDLLFSWSGQPETSIDAFWWRGPEGWLNQHIFRVTPNGDIDNTFFFYLLRYLKPNFIAIARNKQTTGLGHVTKRDLENIEAAIPPLPEQRAIAHVLGTLDDKIELNRKTNETLEAMAQALFKSWFVDFDPVRAKAEGRPIGLPDEISALFPDSFQDSEMGEIPRGWGVDSIYSLANVIYGAPFSSKLFNTKGIGKPLARIRDLKSGSPGVFTEEVHPKGCLIKSGDIVVGMDGEFRPYLWVGEDCWMNQRVCKFVPTKTEYSCFIRNSIRQLLLDVEMSETATTVIHLGKSDIDGFRILVPGTEILNCFSSITLTMEQSIVSHEQQAKTLRSLRDTLLPKLLSGELRVPDANQLEEVLGHNHPKA